MASINQGNRAIRPYLITSLLGFHYDEERRQAWIKENDRLMYQYLRIMKHLCGPGADPLISNKACVKYFHTQLGYKVVGRTKTNNASLAKDNLFKLRLNYENPVIDVLLKYREVQKQTGTLQFKVWKVGSDKLDSSVRKGQDISQNCIEDIHPPIQQPINGESIEHGNGSRV
jgi:hypothetical protein